MEVGLGHLCSQVWGWFAFACSRSRVAVASGGGGLEALVVAIEPTLAWLGEHSQGVRWGNGLGVVRHRCHGSVSTREGGAACQ